MKIRRLSRLLISLLIVSYSAISFAGIAGTWQGTLEVAPGNKLDIQFIIEEKDDGTVSVVLNSPESGAIKNVKANSASLSGKVLKLEVTDLSGSYEGTLADGAITGKWSQVGESFPLVLKPFAEKLLSPEIIAQISGRWQGIFEPPGQKVNVALTIEESEPGKVRALFEQLDAGARLPLPDIKVEGTTISFYVGGNGPKYTGTVDGNDLKGSIAAGGQTFPGNFSKKAFNPRDYALTLSDEGKKLLLGQWHGEMTTPVGDIVAVFRFEEVEPGFIRGYFDSPDRGATGIPLKEAKLEGTAVTLTVGNGSSFIGTLEGGALTGEYSSQGQKLPVTLKKGQLPALALDIPAQSQTKILGNWTGKLNTPQGELTVGIRFEKTSDGSVVGYLDSPDQGMKGARITFASFDDGALTVRSSPLLRMEYKGTVADNNITGQFSQGGQNLELKLAKTE